MMGKYFELRPEEVRMNCPIEVLPFETTDELEPLCEIIGQNRAVQAMEFGLQVHKPGYNIFMVGPPGTGKATYAQTLTKEIAVLEPVPNDWCYVYNFQHSDEAVALTFPAGEGKRFAERVNRLLESLLKEIPLIFESEEYERQKNEIFNYFQNAKNKVMEELEEFAEERGFILQEKRSGIITVASVDGRPISQEEYDALSSERQDEIQRSSEEIQNKAVEIFRRSREIEREFIEAIAELDQKTGGLIVDFLFREILEEYADYPEVISYLQEYKIDVVESLDDFRSQDGGNELAFLDGGDDETQFQRYQVNLFVDNHETRGAPVIYETNPTFYRLMGKVEYESRVGSLVTSFMQVRPGSIHLANGGYLILSIRDLLVNPESWFALKRALRTEEVQIENLSETYGLVAVASLHPQPIPCNVKIILVGNPEYYYLLLNLDEDYNKLFKIKAEFEDSMDWNQENILSVARFIKGYCDREKLLPFHASAVVEVVQLSARLAGEQGKLSTRFHLLTEALNEAETWAKLEGDIMVRGEHMQKALAERDRRNGRYEDSILDNIIGGTLLIECSGRRVGQVNALVVIDLGDHVFGHPTRVTAVSYRGQRGVIHIERETKMSGAIHDKGLMILSNFLGSRYAQEHPLNLTGSLTFEQVYGGIDGDSASVAELIALLSSIGQVPIYQNIAITGSFNQHGEIQPVGGITEKVEGFFKTCKADGLMGDQGVIIPQQNIKHLVLNDEVSEAVANKRFHIYPIRTVDEGIEILTGLPAGHLRRDQTYPRNTVNYMVQERLRGFGREEKKE